MFRQARLQQLALCALPLAAWALGGCEQTRPPTPAGLKLIKQRTATGTQYSKLEARSQPTPPRAGEVSIWDFKIFEPKDKPDGTRTERKFFAALPQGSNKGGVTQVLMNAWIISDDLTVFQAGKPSYKAYGSFVNGWTIARPGPCMLWVEYEPVQDQSSESGKPLERSKPLGREMARWHFTAAPSSDSSYKLPPATAPQKVSRQGQDETFASLDVSGTASHTVTLQRKPFVRGTSGRFDWKVNAPGEVLGMNVVALAPDRKTLWHWVASSVLTTFDQPGDWHLWFSFEVGGEKFVAPYILKVAT